MSDINVVNTKLKTPCRYSQGNYRISKSSISNSSFSTGGLIQIDTQEKGVVGSAPVSLLGMPLWGGMKDLWLHPRDCPAGGSIHPSDCAPAQPSLPQPNCMPGGMGGRVAGKGQSKPQELFIRKLWEMLSLQTCWCQHFFSNFGFFGNHWSWLRLYRLDWTSADLAWVFLGHHSSGSAFTWHQQWPHLLGIVTAELSVSALITRELTNGKKIAVAMG